MRSIFRSSILCLFAAAACSKGSTTGSSGVLTVTATAASVQADGTNRVTIQVTGASRAPVVLSTNRGTFLDTNASQETLTGTSGSVDLVTCNSRTSTTCAGIALITATDAGLATGSTTVRFLGFENCMNGMDDDGDGLADCADRTDCDGKACHVGPNGTGAVGTCTAGACVCTATAGTETNCSDGKDDDCNGLIDCADPACTGKSCTGTGGVSGTCSASGACACVPTVPAGSPETNCSDGKDDDCNGQIDCADAACNGKACQVAGQPGTCSGSSCVVASCTRTAQTETNCSDGKDDDCNGLTDCLDPACSGQPCSTQNPGMQCVNLACTDPTTGYALQLTPARAALPADGVATTTVTLTAAHSGAPLANTAIQVATTLGTLQVGTGTPAASVTVTTDATGEATLTFISSQTGGTATLTATLQISTPVATTITATTTIGLPMLASIVLNQPLPYTVLGVKGSGFQEQLPITLQVLDSSGQAYPAGLAVRFEHWSLAGSAIGMGNARGQPDATCLAPCMAYTVQTDANGLVSITLYPGTRAGTLGVTATATAGGESRNFVLPSIAVIGARANAGAFTIDCTPKNVPAFQFHDCGVSLVDTDYTCVATLMDRYQNVLGTQTYVTFASETSRIDQVTTTPPFDQTKPDDPNLGTAIQTFHALGGYLPDDVLPNADEPFVKYVDECSVGGVERTHNPRDGAVTVIAIADGEESFTDLNGNGVYDPPGPGTPGEPFIDLGEPFVDYNDNGQYDLGEWFLDVNGNGKWDGPNGQWDAFTKIWTETRIVYTGAPRGPFSATGGYLGTRWIDASAFTNACTPSPAPLGFSVLPQRQATDPNDPTKTIQLPPTTDEFVVVATDGNLNRLATAATYEVKKLDPAQVNVFYNGLPSYADGTGFFFRYWPCDSKGVVCATRCYTTPDPVTGDSCTMWPSISAYGCGLGGGVTIQGGSAVDPGLDQVDWKVTLPPDLLHTYLSGWNCVWDSTTNKCK